MFDIIIILIIVVSMFVGAKKGFVLAIFSFLSIFLSLFLTYVLKDCFIGEVAKSPFGEWIGGLITDSYDGILAQKCSEAIISVTSIVALYFLVKFALKLVGGFLKSVSKIPVINFLNTWAGAIVGLLIGLIWSVIVVNVCYYIPQFTDLVFNSEISIFFLLG